MKADEWQIQTAKDQFSKVVARARSQGVQTITKHGKPVVVVVAVQDFQNMAPKKTKAPDGRGLIALLRRCPAPEVFDMIRKTRPRHAARDLDLD